ncbi:MAG: hypothetical protein WCL44_11675 [bacterium]
MPNASCERCGLYASYPGADLDGTGCCRLCREVEGRVYPSLGDDALREVIARRSDGMRWACLVGYSGGKDSTFMLRRLSEWFPGRVLALTFDTQVMSDCVWGNIDRVVKSLGVEWIKHAPAPGFMPAVYRQLLRRLVQMRSGTIYSRSTVEIGPLCWPCGTLYHLEMLRVARDRAIPTIAIGFTPSQDSSHYPTGHRTTEDPRDLFNARHAPRAEGIAARDYVTMASLVFRLVENELGKEAAAPYRLDRDDPALAPIRMLRFYDYVHYDETAIRQGSAEVGFQYPDDAGYGSSNCAINPLVRYIHNKLFGFDKYMAQDAALVRWGFGKREDVASRVKPPPEKADVIAACKRIGMSLDEVDEMLKAPSPAGPGKA